MIRYPAGVGERIRELATQKDNAGIAEVLNAEFGDFRTWTAEMVKNYKSNHHIRAGRRMTDPMKWSKWPSELLPFVRENTKGRTTAELRDLIREELGIDMTEKQVFYFKKNHRLPSGVDTRYPKGNVPWAKGRKMPAGSKHSCTEFKKGQMPHNYQPVGTVIINGDGYLVKKVEDPNKWEFLHRIVWEEHNGPILPGYGVTFLDGDKTNCDISNLRLITNAENGYINSRHLRSEDPEITETALLVAKLACTAKKRRKET